MASENRAKMDRRTYLTLAGGAAATASLAGCIDSLPVGQSDFEITITQGNMDAGLDPHDHRETNTDIILMQAYEGALDRDREGAVIESLANEWERIEEGHVRLFLREGVTFHNGDELTPADVAFSYNRIVDEEVGGLASPQSDQLAGVTGAEANDDENAVDVYSDGINPMVFGLLASYGDVMQQSWVEENDGNYINSNVNGTGPFTLESYTQDESVVYSAYGDYWGGRADIDGIVFNASTEASTRVNQLVSGETDVVENVPPQEVSRIRDNDETRIEAVPSTRVIYNGMRHDVEPFSSVQFRQAMNYAIDLDSIIENVLSGFADATGQPTLEGFVGHNPDLDPYPYDPDQAEQLVEDSGHADVEIELHSPVGRYLKDVEVAQAVVSYVDELPNVSASLNQRDFGTLAGELTTGNIEDMPHWYLIGWGNETFDASQTLIPLLTTDGALSSWSNEEFDELIAQSQAEADPDAREQQLQDANAIAHEEAPWIFLNRQYSVYGASERIDWQARADESIKAYAMSPK